MLKIFRKPLHRQLMAGVALLTIGMANSQAADLAVVTWTQDEQSPYYCIEPWMGPPNAAETKVGLHSVAPGQTQKFYVEITIG